MSDFYRTVKGVSTAIYKEKMSKFIAFVEPAGTADEARAVVKRYQNEYHDARHVCWAYVMGIDRSEYLSSDNGEPSGTAGKPILGQLNSFELTRVVAVVVRYFGGIKLGTSGLIEAYRTAAQEALNAATIEEKIIEETITIHFQYPLMGDVMRIVKEENATVLSQDFVEDCRLTLSLRKNQMPKMRSRFENTFGVSILEN